MELGQVLADWRERAAVLRHTGHGHDAALVERIVDEIATASHDFLTWLSEDAARMKSGKGVDYFRSRFAGWHAQGLARLDPRRARKRQYLAVIVPQRANLEAAREAGRRAADGAA